MQLDEPGRTRAVRHLAATLAIALLGAVVVSCAPTAPSGPSASEQFCDFWDRVEQDPPSVDNAVLVKDDLVALAETSALQGERCSDPGARVELDSAVLAEGEELPFEEGNAQSALLTVVTGDQLAATVPVFDNLTLSSLDATITPSGISVRGSVDIRISGTTSSIGFVGTLRDLDNWSVTLSSGAFSVPGITTSPAQFVGTLRSVGGVPSLSLNAAVTSARIGDVSVSGAGIALSISPIEGVSASVTGTISVGSTTVNGSVDVEFDRRGTLVAAHADLGIRFQGFLPGGNRVDLAGQLVLDGDAEQTVASFSGSGVLGDLNVNAVNGSLLIEPGRATLIGVLDVDQGGIEVRYNGTVEFDGQNVSLLNLTLAAGGEFSGTLRNGQIVSAKGTVTADVSGGQIVTTLAGEFRFGNIRATGTAVVETDQFTTRLFVDAELDVPGLDATVEGLVVLADGRVERVSLEATVQRLTLRNVTVTSGTLTLRSDVGSDLLVQVAGALRVTASGVSVDLNGTVSVAFDGDGALSRLAGRLSGSASIKGWDLRNLSAEFSANSVTTTLGGNLTVTTANFPLAIPLDISMSAPGFDSPDWTIQGSGPVRIASLNIGRADLRLRPDDDTMHAFNATVRYLAYNYKVQLRLKASGGCRELRLSGGEPVARLILVEVLRDQISNCTISG